MRRLLEAPERWARLVEQPELIPGAVDEMLRFDPSVPVWRRVTKRPVTLEPADQEVPFHPNISFRGPQQLWVRG